MRVLHDVRLRRTAALLELEAHQPRQRAATWRAHGKGVKVGVDRDTLWDLLGCGQLRAAPAAVAILLASVVLAIHLPGDGRGGDDGAHMHDFRRGCSSRR